jgi:hypothetical protein
MRIDVAPQPTMGRPLRFFEPEGLYFVTGRRLQGRLLIRPSPEINRIIGGVLARHCGLRRQRYVPEAGPSMRPPRGAYFFLTIRCVAPSPGTRSATW